MYSFKKALINEYSFRTRNSQTPRRKSLKIILIICKEGLFNEIFGRNNEYRHQSRKRYGVDTGAHWDHTVATPADTALNRDTPC